MGALLTALAISGDLIGRMARNHPLASFGAFGCAAIAVFLGAVAAYGLQEGSREERGVVAAGILVLGGALVFGVYAGVATWGDRAQPSITVTPKSGSLVAVSVHGIGLRSTDHIVVEVEQLLHTSGAAGHESWEPGQPLYGASLGPNSSGEIDQTVNLALPAGDFDDVGARAWVGDEPPSVLHARQHDRLRPGARPAATGAAAAVGRLGDVRQGSAPARQAEGPQSAAAPGAVDDLAGVRHRRGPAATKPRRVVARPERRRRVRPQPGGGRRTRVFRRLCRGQHLDA